MAAKKAKGPVITQEQRDDALLKMKRARIALQEEMPFFSDILFFMKFHEKDSVPTAAIDMNANVYYNAGWISNLTFRQVKGLLVHEAIHPSWMHITRGAKKENQGVWGLAIDCPANWMTRKQNYDLPPDGACMPDIYHNTITVKISGGGGCLSLGTFEYVVKDADNKSAETIYDELMKVMPKKWKDKLGNPGPGDLIVPGDGEDSESLGGYPVGGIDEHIYKGENGQDLSDADIQKQDDVWKQRVINAAERAKQRGKLPAGVDRLVDGILEPKVDWREYLYSWTARGLPSGWTWARRNKRMAAHNVYLPDKKREQIDVFVWIDTSGSIDDALVKQFKGECVGIKRAFPSVNMAIGYCDAKVHSVQSFDNVSEEDIMLTKPLGGGGTDMRECIKWMEKNAPATQAVVILTDGYTPFPELRSRNNQFNILWCICPGGMPREHQPSDTYGEFIYMRSD
jgi:predicted metal-dependent peptidase